MRMHEKLCLSKNKRATDATSLRLSPVATMVPADEAASAAGYPSWLVEGAVPRHSWDDPTVATLLARNEPVVLTGCPLVARLQLDFEALAELCGDHEMGVHTTPPHTRVFARHYGKGLGVGTIESMTFKLFAAKVAAEHAGDGKHRSANYYLQAPLLWRDDDDDGDGELRRAAIPALQDELRRCIDWAWLDRACGLAGAPSVSGCQIWAGHGGGSTPTHFDARDNFLCQLCGAKRVLLLSPAQSLIGLYPYPVGHVKDNFAIADLEQPDLSTFPALARARGVEATLEAGDVLYLPKYYWHLVRQLDGPHNLSLNCWVGGRGNEAFSAEAARWATEVSPPATAAPSEATAAAEDARFESWLLGDGAAALVAFKAGRLAETIAAKTCGGAERGGDFLSAMAAGADAEWAKGSKAARVAARIRGQLSGLCGGSASHASALLRALTRDGRLCPGLAPPVDGPVVASETGEWGA